VGLVSDRDDTIAVAPWSRVELTLRIPRLLLAEVDAYRERLREMQVGAPSRNEVLVSLIERGLRDASRPRGRR
jgi:hypothetical protein